MRDEPNSWVCQASWVFLIKTSADFAARHRFVLAAARLLLTLRHPALVARFAMRLGYLPIPFPSRADALAKNRRPSILCAADRQARVQGLPIPETLWAGRDPAEIPRPDCSLATFRTPDRWSTLAIADRRHPSAMPSNRTDDRWRRATKKI
ncbi:hypothetical protein D3227_19375 [Mesorhizobium waimense]|uniref:Uncharacterized protein n=1 Tax=Mesorhizobium waimense TaxID=1300307 RepID=A0A3A5KVI3_9HYPH|nr:hypothetical protein D3227_19375 [Mesorhizobium waimense]